MLKDIEIAQNNTMEEITSIAKKLNLSEDELELYGKYKAKIALDAIEKRKDAQEGKLILVSAMNPTAAGEGKTTTSVGLSDSLSALGKSTILALREPSLGPTLGLKGGAAGGGYAQVVPMEDINLHFTGDLHAITTANNALAAFIDNHIQQGNELGIDQRRITWKRVLDINDRALRNVVIGLGGSANGIPREDGFNITVASEIMAILCLSKDLDDMKARFANITIGQNYKREPIYVRDLKVEGALTLLMKDALKPNLVQTLEHTPALIHGGPFANIAHGCNSVIATKTALKLADYTVTEAGFGADLGAEKFLDIKVPVLGKAPDAVVLVVTVRSLKMHGGVSQKELANSGENIEAVTKGLANLSKHIENIQSFNLPLVVAINKFSSDTEQELQTIIDYCQSLSVKAVVNTVWADGSVGGLDLARAVVDIVENIDDSVLSENSNKNFKTLYNAETNSIEDKIEKIAKTIYGAQRVEFTSEAKSKIRYFKKHNWDKLAICIAKTQYSLSDDKNKLGRPSDFSITVRDLVPNTGAGFLVALTGDIMTMPGLPKRPAMVDMDVKEDGSIVGLF